MTFIEMRNVWRTYQTRAETIHAVRDVTISIEKGEFRALLGESGSGKTTLLNLIGTLDKPTQGEVYLDNRAYSTFSGIDLNRIRNHHIGYIFQTFFLLEMQTALKNVMVPLLFRKMPREERVKASKEILKRVGLQSRINHRPNQLSGGQKQRVCIARELVKQPDVLLVDEPTSNVDYESSVQIIDLLKEFNRDLGVTIINSSHDLKLVNVADRISWIRDGSIIDTQDALVVELNADEIEV